MENNLCVLDFDENGKASLEIPKVQKDYSFILNHWIHPRIQLEEIENDLLSADSANRKIFLEKIKPILAECLEQYAFNDTDGAVYDEDINDDFTDDWIDDNIPLDKNSEAYLDAQFGNDAEWDFGNWDESENEEEREFNLIGSKANIFLETGEENEYENPQYLIVYNFRLKHSLAWYLMNRVDSEIILIEQQIEKEHGRLKIANTPDGIDKLIEHTRVSCSPFEAQKKIMGYFQLSETQANNLINMKLTDITGATETTILKQIEFYNFIKSLLMKMKL